jgi:hypothetical protein
MQGKYPGFDKNEQDERKRIFRDLDQAHQDQEVKMMSKFFREHFKVMPSVIDLAPMKQEPSPYARLETFWLGLARDVFAPAYDENLNVLLHVYCTGHGYIDNDD